MASDVWEVALRAIRALEQDRLDYALGGALALGIWGQTRGTLDVDLVVFVPLDRLEDVWCSLEKAGAIVERDLCRWQVRKTSYFEVTLDDIRLDVFLPDFELYDWAYPRRRAVQVGPDRVWFWSPEDTLLFKLLFFRLKDKVDIEALVRVQQANLDLAYIRKALSELFADEERSLWFEQLVRVVFGT